MNAVIAETNATAENKEIKAQCELETVAIKELTEIELAYVGGGTACVSFT